MNSDFLSITFSSMKQILKPLVKQFLLLKSQYHWDFCIDIDIKKKKITYKSISIDHNKWHNHNESSCLAVAVANPDIF